MSMRLRDLYNAVIEIGIAHDPRPRAQINKELDEKKKEFERLTEKEKYFFDKEKFVNPYSDSRIYHGTGDEEISSLLVGIDVEVQELLLLERLRDKGRKIDAALTHHPEGRALVSMYEVMTLHTDTMHRSGVPITIAEGVMIPRIRDVSRSLLSANYSRSVDAARLLNIPFLGAHTPADNCVTDYVHTLCNAKKPEKVRDVIDLLLDIEEYRESHRADNGPRIVCGAKNNRAGNIYVDMTGGTEGPNDALEKLAHAGVGTVIAMHMSKDHLKKAEEHHLNVIIAGHMASDAVGLNIVFDEVEQRLGPLEIIECSGFIRVKRK